ncbi:uncharacterized protein VP01_1566g14 [Puccinia sorghi]|uniref:Uncharacterized protein n=1 Tax=Puccinia sorghi TaxID=27349 RepID=A0A0L6VII4_9BASI|nr:uncharacterized protein VP01_1566g14 [Puccinia sorghi]
MYTGAKPLHLNASDEEMRQRIALIRRGHMVSFIVIFRIFIIIWALDLGYKSMERATVLREHREQTTVEVTVKLDAERLKVELIKKN